MVAVATKTASFGERARGVLEELFETAYRKAPFHFLCTLLRVEPVEEVDWDPLLESHAALQQYANEIHGRSGTTTFARADDRRLALLIYCHLSEISAIYQVLGNLLRCAKSYPYLLDPFSDLVRGEVRKEARRAATPAQKIARLKELDSPPGRLSALLAEFFDGELRDAFYRSEYVLLPDTLRYRSAAGSIESLPWPEVQERVRHATAFYNAFFGEYHAWRGRLGNLPLQQRLPGNAVLLLEADAQGALCGFNWKRADGTVSSFRRSEGIVVARGFPFGNRGDLPRVPHWTVEE